MYTRVYVEITNICNMNCSFCHGHKRTLRRMSYPEFCHILDQLSDKTKYIYYHLMGEPLSHPELGKFIKTAKERGFHSILTTNGTLLDKRGAELIASGVHKMNLSIHSFEGQDETAFEAYMDKVVSFAQEASEAGIIIIFRLWNRGCDDGRNEKIISYLSYRLGGEWRENARGIRIGEKIHLEWGERFEWPDKEACDYGSHVFCYGMRDHFGILCDGTVVPCCLDSDGVIALGNVFRDDLTEIISSERARAIAKGFDRREAVEELCRRCGYAQRFSKGSKGK